MKAENSTQKADGNAIDRPVVALVTAYNESSTIGGVLDALRSSPLVDRIQVVDDASEDDTSEVARARSGVKVIRLETRVPVGKALMAHLPHLEEENAIVLFCDADLLHLNRGHVEALIKPVLEGRAGMSVGLKDKPGGPLIKYLTKNVFPKADILIGGERAMYREIADSILDGEHTSGYGLVIVMNRFCRKYSIPTEIIYLDGCNHRHKIEKWKMRDAIPGFMSVIYQIGKALLVTRFRPSTIPIKKFDKIPELNSAVVDSAKT